MRIDKDNFSQNIHSLSRMGNENILSNHLFYPPETETGKTKESRYRTGRGGKSRERRVGKKGREREGQSN